MSNKSEPVAWMNPDDDDSFKFMEHSAKLAWIESCGNNCRVAKVYTVPLYTHPAPALALTAELQKELLEALDIGLEAVDTRCIMDQKTLTEKPMSLFKIRAAIKELEAMLTEELE